MQIHDVDYRAGSVNLRGYLAYDDNVTARRPGVLVLSETTGVAAEAEDSALLVSPLDIEGTTQALARGLDLARPARARLLAPFRERIQRWTAQDWLSAQFHGIHLAHVRVVEGVDGITDEDGAKVLSCSSCHKSGYMGRNVDRTYPRTTCGRCHNAKVFNEPTASFTKAETPSCTSCHLQHVKDTHWTASLLSTQTR